MKNTYRLLVLSFLVLFLTACGSSETDQEITEILELSAVNEFSAFQETQDVNITANMYWFINVDADWILVSPKFVTNNATTKITVATNPLFENEQDQL